MSERCAPRGRWRATRAGLRSWGALLLLAVGGVAARAAPPAADPERVELLRRSDVTRAAPASFRAELEVRLLGGSDRGGRLEVWKGDEGRVLVRFLDPGEEGKFLLQREDGTWFISPGASKPVALGPSYRLWGVASLQELLGLRYSQDYAIAGVEEKGEGASRQVVFGLEAIAEGVPYPQVRYVVGVEDERPLRAELLLASGKVARVVEFRDWQDAGLEPRVLVIKEVLRGGRPVEVTFHAIEPRLPPAGIFELDGHQARSDLATSGP